ncbi:hypothetical protein RS030_172634 [Cryptosporidium xiaoi]|uniref:SAP domain-containing protein n=1 Tax=Cryptosporidium xiaoi TaxID=659607 RepID=A0AAV9XZP6_9CRYT
MNNSYHQERSRLIQKHKEEIKSIEKEIKSKKGILKEQLQKKLSQTLERHQKDIEDFEYRHNGDSNRKKDEKAAADNNSECNGDNKILLFEERQWNSLSKSELESECKLRGINSKGNKEDLVTRLFIFTADQKSKFNSLSEDSKKNAICNSVKNNELNVFIKAACTEEINKATPPEINFSEAGGTGKKKFRNQSKKIDHRRNVRPGENSWAAFCARNDISRKKNIGLNIHEDSDLEDNDEENRIDKQSECSSSSEEDGNVGIDEEHEKISKRRVVMVKVLEKMFSKVTINEKKDGIKLSDINLHLTRLNVKNFRPELLGYKSIEDWISSQSKKTLTYDSINKVVFPPGYRISDSKESNEDDVYYIDSLDEYDSNDDFM